MDRRGGVALVFALVALAFSFFSRRALAWQEAHEVGDDVVVRVDPNGVASVQHALRWHVVRGPLRSIDLVNVEPGASVEPNVVVTTEEGRELAAHAGVRDDGADGRRARTVRVTTDDPHAFMHGTFSFAVHLRVDLAAARALARDGAMWRLAWSSPVASDGFDAARTVFDLPAAPDEPRPVVADTGAVDDGAVSTLRREAGRDVLELVRPHVARGETVRWTVRVDPRALPQVADPRLRPAEEASAPPEPDRVREVSLAAALAGLAVAFGAIVAQKTRAFAAVCAAHRCRPRGLLPLPDGARAAVAGVAWAAAVGLQIYGERTAGALLVALATIAAALRAPDVRPAARGPGRWLALRPDDAFAAEPRRGHWLDIGAPEGRRTAAMGVAAAVGVALVARRFDPLACWLVALDTAALLPLLVTGRRSQLPPDAARSAAPWLARAYRRLRAIDSVRVAPWARVALDGSATDELRLLILPRAAMPGVVGVEIGLAWSSTPVGWTAAPEVLVRVLDASAAAVKIGPIVAPARAVPGRRPDERVVRLVPRRPTCGAAVALARALAGELTERRVAFPGVAAPVEERRIPRPARPTPVRPAPAAA
jgi:hypothetical protein